MCAAANQKKQISLQHILPFSDKWRHIHRQTHTHTHVYIYHSWKWDGFGGNSRSSLQGRSWKTWSVCWEEIVPPVCLRATFYLSQSRPEWRAGARQTAPTQVPSALLSCVLPCTSPWFALQFFDSAFQINMAAFGLEGWVAATTGTTAITTTATATQVICQLHPSSTSQVSLHFFFFY